MRVILVDNLLFENIGAVRHFDLQPHLGLISLLGAIENVGHEAVLFDPKLEVTSGRVPFDEWDPLESTCRHASLSIL